MENEDKEISTISNAHNLITMINKIEMYTIFGSYYYKKRHKMTNKGQQQFSIEICKSFSVSLPFILLFVLV